MPRKEKEYRKNINIRVTNRQWDRWVIYAKNNRFVSLFALVRFAVEELIEDRNPTNKELSNQSVLEDKINELDRKYNEILSQYNKLLKEVVQTL